MGQRSYGSAYNRSYGTQRSFQGQSQNRSGVIQSPPQQRAYGGGNAWRGRGDSSRWSGQQAQRPAAQAAQPRAYSGNRFGGGNRGGDRGERRGRQ